MLDRNVFMETLRDVAEIVRTAAEPLEREEILSYFKDMNLTKEQEDMVFTYLSTPHEDEVAEPVEAQIPFISSQSSMLSPSMNSKPIFTSPGRRFVGCPLTLE